MIDANTSRRSCTSDCNTIANWVENGNQRGGYPNTRDPTTYWTYKSYAADETTKIGDPWCEKCTENCLECVDTAPT